MVGVKGYITAFHGTTELKKNGIFDIITHLYCVAEIATEVSMLMLASTHLVECSYASDVDTDTPYGVLSSHSQLLNAQLTVLAS